MICTHVGHLNWSEDCGKSQPSHAQLTASFGYISATKELASHISAFSDLSSPVRVIVMWSESWITRHVVSYTMRERERDNDLGKGRRTGLGATSWREEASPTKMEETVELKG